ncbi:MAG TPA: hypothetical protein VHV10_06995, partial [Ktedonobacteraceae bacterium]|nr:hypothetical protein [Ktedonobacteraceae bacterium]
SKKHKQNHKEFTDTFPSNIVENWNTMVESWQHNPRALNPFEEPIASRFRIIFYQVEQNLLVVRHVSHGAPP